MIGEYGASASDVIAETIWLQPEVANDDLPIGGDDGIGGYAPLAVATGSGTSAALTWVHGNHLGVPIAYTDQSGAAVPPPSYTLPGFPGQMRTLPDLYYNRHRDYDSATGRYIQADPIGLEGGNNPYLYAEGNPLRYVDPKGHVATAVRPFFRLLQIFGLGGTVLQNDAAKPPPTRRRSASKQGWTPDCGTPDPCEGLRFQLKDHQRKLREYKADPLRADNHLFLASALRAGDMERYNSIYNGRIRSLQNQINNFRKLLEECERLHGYRD